MEKKSRASTDKDKGVGTKALPFAERLRFQGKRYRIPSVAPFAANRNHAESRTVNKSIWHRDLSEMPGRIDSHIAKAGLSAATTCLSFERVLRTTSMLSRAKGHGNRDLACFERLEYFLERPNGVSPVATKESPFPQCNFVGASVVREVCTLY